MLVVARVQCVGVRLSHCLETVTLWLQAQSWVSNTLDTDRQLFHFHTIYPFSYFSIFHLPLNRQSLRVYPEEIVCLLQPFIYPTWLVLCCYYCKYICRCASVYSTHICTCASVYNNFTSCYLHTTVYIICTIVWQCSVLYYGEGIITFSHPQLMSTGTNSYSGLF